MISIDLDDIVTDLGEMVRGQVSWDPLGDPPKELSVQLGFVTEGRGEVDRGVVAGIERTFDGDPAMTAPWMRFELQVPADGPVTYDGNLIRVRWWVEAAVKVSWRNRPTTSVDLHVLARGVPHG